MKILKIAILVLLLIIVLFVYVFKIEPRHLVVEKISLPANISNPVRVVHISDLHIHSFTGYQAKVISRVNELAPDLILITGDLFPGSNALEETAKNNFPAHLQPVDRFLAGLEAPYGVWLSRGNVDLSNDKEISDLLPEFVNREGVFVFTNTDTVIAIGQDSLYLAGVDYTGLNIRDIANFSVTEFDGEQVMQSPWSRKNSYSHYARIKDRSHWKNYTMTGRMRLTRTSRSGIGVTFYSQLDRGYDKFYRLRQANTDGTFHFSPHGTTVFGDSLDTGFSPKAERWMRYRIECTSHSQYTQMRAKVWYEDSPEPLRWMAVARDTSKTRLVAGSAGLWSGGMGDHQFDDVSVVTAAGETLLYETFDDFDKDKDAPGWVDFGYSGSAIKHLLHDAPRQYYRILMSHSPDFVYTASDCGVDLMLSGHTHGGQVRLPIIGPLYKNVDLARKYVKGLHSFGETTLYVTRGIGTVLFPVRFLCPPEITVIDLKPKEDGH